MSLTSFMPVALENKKLEELDLIIIVVFFYVDYLKKIELKKIFL